jgi:hypothetical protein
LLKIGAFLEAILQTEFYNRLTPELATCQQCLPSQPFNNEVLIVPSNSVCDYEQPHQNSHFGSTLENLEYPQPLSGEYDAQHRRLQTLLRNRIRGWTSTKPYLMSDDNEMDPGDVPRHLPKLS